MNLTIVIVSYKIHRLPIGARQISKIANLQGLHLKDPEERLNVSILVWTRRRNEPRSISRSEIYSLDMFDAMCGLSPLLNISCDKLLFAFLNALSKVVVNSLV